MAEQPTPPQDYTSWSTSDLVRRVTELEAELRARNASHSTGPSTTPAAAVVDPAHEPTSPEGVGPPHKQKPKKAPKQIDASHYHTRHIALKFAYLGGNYNGFEHTPNNPTPLPTIEEEVWRALRKTRLIFPEVAPGQQQRRGNFDERGNEELSWLGTEYSKCGRTDRGVSAFGQVIGVRVRSSRPKVKGEGMGAASMEQREDGISGDEDGRDGGGDAFLTTPPASPPPPFDPIRDELPYIQLLNRVLPPDIRILAWCPSPPADFSARFNCKERRYRYFFTNPAWATSQTALHNPVQGDGLLDIEAMQEAASKYIGLHDFRNFCKIDPSKQITNWKRRIYHAGIHEVVPGRPDAKDVINGADLKASSELSTVVLPKLYYFEVRGSAFLWHQVRHLIAVLFLVGQGYETPAVVADLLNVEKTPARPHYEMANDAPLVLWDCIFPHPDKIRNVEHETPDGSPFGGYEDSLDWIYVGEDSGGVEKEGCPDANENGKYGRKGIMDELWALWRKRKIDEVLADTLMSVVAGLGSGSRVPISGDNSRTPAESQRIFDGSERPRPRGKYTPVLQRARLETPEVVNARWLVRKGRSPKPESAGQSDGDE